MLTSDADKYFFLREMHHRIANSFTVLNASFRRELGSASSLSVQEILNRCDARMVAFDELHRVLIVGAAVGWISVRVYIEKLCDALTEALLKPLGVRCEVTADAAFFPSEYCEVLGLVIAELVTNAAKHAFPNRNGGLIRIEIAYREGCWCCSVTDNGIGATGPLQGTGGRILQGLARSIRARVHGEAGRGGTRVTIMMPPRD